VSGGHEFRALGSEEEAERYIEAVLPWVHEAGNPYLDWLLGSPEVAESALRAWMSRPSSEVSIRRFTVLMEDGRAAGGFVGVGGDDLQACLRADSVAALKAVGREGRRGLLERAAAVADLRRPVEPDEWYLSKLGVVPELRRGGRGRALLREYLDAGRRAGYRRFRLDVWREHAGTVDLYRSAGFEVLAESEAKLDGMTLLSMGMED